MKDRINQYIEKLEQEKEIIVLWACETGSRAWGFPSPDSDFDVRIIYMHRTNWYLSIFKQKDSLDVMYEDNEIDISRWELKKSLKLLMNSNAALLERIQSPIIYKQDAAFIEDYRTIAQTQYSRIATIHHYLSMAKRFREEVKGKKEYKLKKFFYALRSATACLWILEKEEMPPIVFSKMLEGLNIDPSLTGRIYELIQLKSTISENYLHEGEQHILEFIDKCITQAENKKNSLPSAKGNPKELDDLFLKTLSRYDHK